MSNFLSVSVAGMICSDAFRACVRKSAQPMRQIFPALAIHFTGFGPKRLRERIAFVRRVTDKNRKFQSHDFILKIFFILLYPILTMLSKSSI